MKLKFYKIKPNLDWQMKIDTDIQYDHFLLLHESLISVPSGEYLFGINEKTFTPYHIESETIEGLLELYADLLLGSEVDEELVELEVEDDITT